MGLQVSWFEVDCWMYFYACSSNELGSWEQSIDNDTDELLDFPPVAIGHEGHMATEVQVERDDIDLANKIHIEFKAYQPDITTSRLTKYLSAFRNYMELALVPRNKATLDQRVFDGFVWSAVNTNFGNFTETVVQMPQAKAERAARMMYRQGQLFAKSLARKFGVDVLWHYPGQFLEPLIYEDNSHVAPSFAPHAPNPVSPNLFHPPNHYAYKHFAGGKGIHAGAKAGHKGGAKGFKNYSFSAGQKKFGSAHAYGGFAYGAKGKGKGYGKPWL
jgi:hypothetical protein